MSAAPFSALNPPDLLLAFNTALSADMSYRPVNTTAYRDRIYGLLQNLEIPVQLPSTRKLLIWPEAQELTGAGYAASGKEMLLVPAAAEAWQKMQAAALTHSVELGLISAFRSVDYQVQLIDRKRQTGVEMSDILTVLAPPGYSEHHTGCAVDIGTPGCPALSEQFEETSAYHWLSAHAGEFGFFLSFPRNNPFGYIYEPWHWCFRQ